LDGEFREALVRLNPEITTKRNAKSGDDTSIRQKNSPKKP
jgi:hypothetical protein